MRDDLLFHFWDIRDREATHSLLSVDMFTGEHTELMKGLHWLNHQTVHTIGPHVTAKHQVTDVHYSVLGKQEQKRRAPEIRGRMRRLAARQGTAAILIAKHTELLLLATYMHQACVQDNEEKDSVLKTFRAAGYLSHVPTTEGWLPATGPEWEKYPLGSSRFPPSVLAQKQQELEDNGGVPPVPD